MKDSTNFTSRKNAPAVPAIKETTPATTSVPAPTPAEVVPPQAPKFKITVANDYVVGDDRKEYAEDLRVWLEEYLNLSDTQRKMVDKGARRVIQETRKETQLEKLKARLEKLTGGKLEIKTETPAPVATESK